MLGMGTVIKACICAHACLKVLVVQFGACTDIHRSVLFSKLRPALVERRVGLRSNSNCSSARRHGGERRSSRRGNVDTTSFLQRVEELFGMIANAGAVSSEPAGLIVAVVHMDLKVTQELIIAATKQVLPSTQTMFSKDDVMRLLDQITAGTISERRRGAVPVLRDCEP